MNIKSSSSYCLNFAANINRRLLSLAERSTCNVWGRGYRILTKWPTKWSAMYVFVQSKLKAKAILRYGRPYTSYMCTLHALTDTTGSQPCMLYRAHTRLASTSTRVRRAGMACSACVHAHAALARTYMCIRTVLVSPSGMTRMVGKITRE